jgi:hypothetical protein
MLVAHEFSLFCGRGVLPTRAIMCTEAVMNCERLQGRARGGTGRKTVTVTSARAPAARSAMAQVHVGPAGLGTGYGLAAMGAF